MLEQIRQLYPCAPFFTTVAKPQSLGPLRDAEIHTTYLQHLYNLTGNHQILLPFMSRAIESIDLTGYDVILSSSHAVGKGIIPPSNALHICYCHTPVRYAWEMEDEYLRDFHVPHFIRPFVKKQLMKLRRWDLTTAKRVDVFIANSTTTQNRIKTIYGRDSIVLPPPVEDRFFESRIMNYELGDGSYFLALGRLVPYKRFDLLIQLANELQLPLKIAGRGQDEDRLKKLAGPTVEFLGFVPDEELVSVYANAEGFFFPQMEDAGIAILEAQACGTPVIAYRAGGATDAVIENKTGVFAEKQTTESLCEALKKFRTMKWDREVIRNHARSFSVTHFREKMQSTIQQAYASFAKKKP